MLRHIGGLVLLLAASLATFSTGQSAESEGSIPLDVKCPTPQNNVADIISGKTQKLIARVRLIYKTGLVIRGVMAERDSEGVYRDMALWNMEDRTWWSPNSKPQPFTEIMEKVLPSINKVGDATKRLACDGTADERAKYQEVLRANRLKILGNDRL